MAENRSSREGRSFLTLWDVYIYVCNGNYPVSTFTWWEGMGGGIHRDAQNDGKNALKEGVGGGRAYGRTGDGNADFKKL